MRPCRNFQKLADEPAVVMTASLLASLFGSGLSFAAAARARGASMCTATAVKFDLKFCAN